MAYVNKDLLLALDRICAGRVVLGPQDLIHSHNPRIVTKTSHIGGKSVTELPGLVFGDLRTELNSVGLAMTMTENVIELAGAISLDALIIHHPVADGASSGGVLIQDYLNLYDLALFELHEAFHGTHPGAAYLHGFDATLIHAGYHNHPGVNVYVGKALPQIRTVADLLTRQQDLLSVREEGLLLEAERDIRTEPHLQEMLVSTAPELLTGDLEARVGMIAQFAPHSGFNADLLQHLLDENPKIDTLIAAKGKLRQSDPLVSAGAELGLNVLNGNCHGYEVYENWMPLAAALQIFLPGLEVHIIRERVVASPFEETGSPALREYAKLMAERHLVTKEPRILDSFRHGGSSEETQA